MQSRSPRSWVVHGDSVGLENEQSFGGGGPVSDLDHG